MAPRRARVRPPAHASFAFEEGPSVRSVDQFVREVRRFGNEGDFRVYFRGEGQPSSGLMPSIGRSHFYLGRSIRFDGQTERRLLVQFRRHAYEHFGRLPSEWETLFLARHYGMPTRLLDWTSNPLVALYFAAFYENEAVATLKHAEPGGTPKLNLDGTIWAVQRRESIAELDIFSERRPPLQIRGIKLVHPFNPTPRMTAQSGYFTLHADPWTDTVRCAGKRYRASDLDISRLIKWRVESRFKTGIVLDLERLAINSRTLFPDLEGLGRGIWQTEVIRRCFREQREQKDGVGS